MSVSRRSQRLLFILTALTARGFSDFGGPILAAQESPAELASPAGTDSGLRGSIVEDRTASKLIEAGDARMDANEPDKAIEIWDSVLERYPRSRYRF